MVEYLYRGNENDAFVTELTEGAIHGSLHTIYTGELARKPSDNPRKDRLDSLGWETLTTTEVPVTGGVTDAFGLKALELTDAAIGLDADAQRTWVNDAFEVLSEDPVGTLGSAEDIADATGPQVRVCTTTVGDAR